MQDFKEHDFDAFAQQALDLVQFGFPMKPISVNAAYVPTVNHATRRADVRLSADAVRYKNNIYSMLLRQKQLQEWQTYDRYFSMWVIVSDKCKCDIDNIHKLISDAFVTAGVIPDDRYAKDTRQIYADFSKSKRVASSTMFGVYIRWGKEIKS